MKRVLVAIATTALLAGCSLPDSVTGDKAKDPAKDVPTVSVDGGAPAQGTGSPLPNDAGSLASMAQSLAGQQSTAAVPSQSATTAVPTATYGADIGWPNCPAGMGIPEKRSTGEPMPLPDASFVVIGLTNGPGFVRNPCLRDQAQWAKVHRLEIATYSVLSYPDAKTLQKYATHGPFDPSDEIGRLKNVGYAQATFNVGAMGVVGLQTPIVWLDVENVPHFDWPSGNQQRNAAIVQGAARGYHDAGYKVGVYGTPSIWRGIVGSFRLGSNVPEWRAAGQTSAAEAQRRCSASWSIQGGSAVLAQWIEARRDRNLICPGVSGTDPWFHQS
ncbi:hypothetical protein [Nocardioides montaniterrae]